MLVGIMPAAVQADGLAVLTHDGSGGYYVNMPATETDVLDLTDRSVGFSFKVYDNGGKNDKYTASCDGYLTVTAPADCAISVSGTLKVERDLYDYLTFYDGADTSEYIGQQKYYGTSVSLSDIYSSGNTMKIYFHSDSSVQNDGFDLNVEFVSSSSLRTLSFAAGEGSGTMTSITRPTGESVTLPYCDFTPPEGKLFSHYTDGVNNYSAEDVITLNADLALTAVYATTVTVTYYFDGDTGHAIGPQGETITLDSFASMFTLPGKSHFCCWKDENDVEYAEGDPFTLTEDVTLTAVLEYDPVVVSDGNGGWYAEMPKTGTAYADLTDKSAGFSFTLYDDGGKDGNYSTYCNSKLYFTAPAGCAFRVSGTLLTEARYDYLLIYDGTLLVDEYYDSIIVTEFETDSDVIEFDFVSDVDTCYSGFALTVTLISNPRPATLNYYYNDSESSVSAMTGDTVTMPTFESAFGSFGYTVPTGKRFAGWTNRATGTLYQAGASYLVASTNQFDPTFADISAWTNLSDNLAAMAGTVTVTLDGNAVAEAGDSPISIPQGAYITVDLNGHRLNGASAAGADGVSFIVNGSLTIIDSAGGGSFGGGNITVNQGGAVSLGSFASSYDASLTQRHEIYDHNDPDDWVTYIHSVTYFESFEDAMTAATELPDYASSLSDFPEDPDDFCYSDPLITLLRNITIAYGETVDAYNPDHSIIIDMNGKALNVYGTLTGCEDLGGGSYERTSLVFDSTTPGTFRSTGEIGVELNFSGDTVYIMGGHVYGGFYPIGGDVLISGGVFTGEVFFYNGEGVSALSVNIYGDTQIEHLGYNIDPGNSKPYMLITGNVSIGEMSMDALGSGIIRGDVLVLNNAYFGMDPNTLISGELSANIVVNGNVEAYTSQLDWTADTTRYGWRVKEPTSISGNIRGSTISYWVTSPPAGAVLIGARYDNGVLTDTKFVNNIPASGYLTMDGTGDEFKLFIWNMNMLLPLCEAWEN